jgi:hypothetical protein
MLVGFAVGYRASWDSVVGKVVGDVFQPNEKAWGGDHCIDPRAVPGVFFCNRRIEGENPRILDIAPSVLELFGVDKPDFMDGKSFGVVIPGARTAKPAAEKSEGLDKKAAVAGK